jgi:hypothetical protein
MLVLKAQFKDESGYYTMTWSFNPELWTVRDLLAYECKESKSQLIKIISNEKLNQSTQRLSE